MSKIGKPPWYARERLETDLGKTRQRKDIRYSEDRATESPLG